MVESVHCGKINSRGNCNNSPHPLQSVQKKSKLNPGFKAMSEWRREEKAPRFAGDHTLTGKLVPMFSASKAPWMLKAWLWAPLLDYRQRGPPAFSLLQVSASRSAVASSSHGLFSTAAPWPPAPGLRPRTAGVKQKQNPGTLGETQKDLQAMSSAWEASFSPSPSWQCSFWAHNTGPLLLLLLTEGEETRGSHIPMHPPRKQFSVSDPSLFNNIGW